MSIARLADGRLMDVNDAFLSGSGYSREELIGRTALQIGLWYDPDDRTRLLDLLHEHGSARDFEATARTKSGELRQVLLSAEIVRLGGEDSVLITTTDITERKQHEEALRESEERFRSAFEYAAIGISLVAIDGRFLKVNDSLRRITGYSAEELLDRTWQSITYPADILPDLRHVRRLLGGEIRSYQMEKRYLHKEGHVIWVMLSVSLCHDAEGRPRYFISQVQDITDRKRAEGALRESEERFRVVARATNDVIWDWDIVNDTVWWSENITNLFGYPLEEVGPDCTWWNVRIHPDDRAWVVSGFYSTLDSQGNNWSAEYRFQRADGSYAYVLERAYVIRDEVGRAVRMIGSMVDITGHKAHEDHLRDHAASQTVLLNQLLSAQEVERRRLSMEIHDGPLQSLGVSLLALDRVLRRYGRGEHDLVQRELDSLRSNLAGTVREVRSVLSDLSLDVLQSYGLAVALQGHVAHFSEVTGIEVVMSHKMERRISPELELLMYRLTQEALANVRKHSLAAKATVTLEERGNALSLAISDEGRGFNVEQVLSEQALTAGHHMGLRSMRQRIEAAGGEMQIWSHPNEGTTVRFSCPVG